jgi:hypothetical protein
VKENAEFYAEAGDKRRADADDVSVYGEAGKYYAMICDEGAVPEYDEDTDEYADDEGPQSIFTAGPYPDYDTAEREGIKQAKLYNASLHENTFIISVYVKLDNPLILHGIIPRNKEFAAAKSAGHDGIIAVDVYDGDRSSDVIVAFSPNQIKSATHNNGNFDPNDSDIRK